MSDTKKPEKEKLTPEKLKELIEEGAELCREFKERTKCMRILTAEDWFRVCR